MQVAILEMPAEQSYKVKLDETDVPGYLKKNQRNERFVVHYKDREGAMSTLRTEPWSREGAACLLLFHHFEQERRRIREQEAERQREAREADRKRAAEETASEETSADS